LKDTTSKIKCLRSVATGSRRRKQSTERFRTTWRNSTYALQRNLLSLQRKNWHDKKLPKKMVRPKKRRKRTRVRKRRRRARVTTATQVKTKSLRLVPMNL